MTSIGQILRQAREAKGLTIPQVAEGTRSKSQVIQALEKDDYSRFPAPIYTKGFIKIYAEYVGLDAGELLALYQAGQAESDKRPRPPSVLKPSVSASVAAQGDLPLPPPPLPAPAESVAPPAETPPAAPARPAGPELPLDLFSSPPDKAAAAPDPAPAEPPAPPPRRKAVPVRPPPRAPSNDEFSLEVRPGGFSKSARDRAASLWAAARRSALHLPWAVILPRAGAALGVLLAAWLFLSLVRGCAQRRAAARPPAAAGPAVPFRQPPDPPPLYLEPAR